MDREKFRELVARAAESLPDEFARLMDNVDVLVEDRPSASQTVKSGIRRDEILLGLYEGIPRTRRNSQYGLVPPDKITLFQKAIESICHNDDEMAEEIRRVVLHEIAHHFGISDARLKELEKRERF